MARSIPGIWSNIETRRMSEHETLRLLKLWEGRAHRAALEAISLGHEWEAAVQRADDARLDGDSASAIRLGERRELLHVARCAKMAEHAAALRMCARYVAGDLVIDESTAGTGLGETERSMIGAVAGASEWMTW